MKAIITNLVNGVVELKSVGIKFKRGEKIILPLDSDSLQQELYILQKDRKINYEIIKEKEDMPIYKKLDISIEPELTLVKSENNKKEFIVSYKKKKR